MIIVKGVSVPSSLPALYLNEHRILLLADLHIGYESALKQKGVHLPQASFPYIKHVVESLIESTSPEGVVFLGDLKHEFGKPSAQEWVEVQSLLATLINLGVKVHVVRGNHDNYILKILSRFNVGLHDPMMRLGDFVLIHGDKLVEIPKDAKTVIMAHEHPAVSSRDISGSRYKFKCFLVGKYEKYRLVVMPALSPLSSGVGINETRPEDLLSPILRRTDIDKFTPIAVEEGLGVFRFPQIGLMRSVFNYDERQVPTA
jgi:putative SbcD/Mre11-related phosphoesterase